MSLINDMLRDLDQRKALSREAEAILPKVARPQQVVRSSRRVWGAALVGVSAVLVAVVGWQFWLIPKEEQAEIVAEQPMNTSPPVDGESRGEELQTSRVVSEVQPAPVAAQVLELSVAEIDPAEPVAAHKIASIPVSTESVSKVPVQDPDLPAPTPVAELNEPVREEAISTVQPAQVAVVAEPVMMKDETAVQPVGGMAKTPVLTAEQRDQQAVAEARNLWHAGRTLEAENLLRRHVAEFSESAASRVLLSQWLMSSGRDGEAAVLLREVNTTSSPELKMIKARLLQAQGQHLEAVNLLEAGAPALKDDVAYHVLLAALYSQAGRFETAVNAYASLVAQNSGKADWWAGLGIALEGDGKPEPARRAYLQAASLNGLHPQLQSYVNERLQALQR